jgi:hypothetical protein
MVGVGGNSWSVKGCFCYWDCLRIASVYSFMHYFGLKGDCARRFYCRATSNVACEEWTVLRIFLIGDSVRTSSGSSSVVLT